MNNVCKHKLAYVAFLITIDRHTFSNAQYRRYERIVL